MGSQNTSKVIYNQYGLAKTPYCSAYKSIFPMLFELVKKWNGINYRNS